MGYAEASKEISAVYREGVDDDRLKAVTDHVHQWLFPPDGSKAQPKPAKKEPTRKRPAKPPVTKSQPQP